MSIVVTRELLFLCLRGIFLIKKLRYQNFKLEAYNAQTATPL